MIATALLQHIRYQFRRNRSATLVLLVLPGIREERDDGGDPLGARNLARMDHNTKLDQRVVDRIAVGGTARVDDVHVAFADGLHELDGGLPDCIASDDGLG